MVHKSEADRMSSAYLRDNPLVGRMLVGGEMVEAAQGGWIESFNPATEQYIGKVPLGTSVDVEAAVLAAERGQREWAALPVAKRAEYMNKLGDAILERSDDLLAVEVADTGNPISPMRNDIVGGVADLRYFAGLGFQLQGISVPATTANFHFTVHEPYGVVGRILAFNHPIYFAISGMAAPLIAGNSVILKPSEQSPLSASLLGEIIRDTLPPGVVNMLSGDWRVGDALVRHPRVKRLSFVGSSRTGMAIQRAAAEVAVKNVSLELGGKNPFIAFADAPVDKVADAAVAAMNFNWQGQSCSSTSRLFLHESIHDAVLERIIRQVGEIVPGDPFEPETRMGAINSKAHYDRILSFIEAGKEDGARLVAGGGSPQGAQFEKGYWISPTVFSDVTPDMRIAREEIFGPILSVMRWSDLDEVIDTANAVEYGLTALVWTNDIRNAVETSKRLQVGHIWINGINGRFRGMPYGGYKNSGVGRECTLEEVRSYSEEKAINIMM